MSSIALALRRSFVSMMRPRVLFHLMWPTVLAVVIWVPLAIAGARALGELVAGTGGNLSFGLPPELGMSASLSAGELGKWMVWLLVALIAFPMIYLTSALIVGLFVVPLIADRVAREHYADLKPRQGGSFMGSLGNSLGAGLGVILLGLLCLPLLLIPLTGFVLPWLLSAWLAQRTYSYDALMTHASHAERVEVLKRNRSACWGVSLFCAAMAYVPLINFFAPAFTGLVFVHFCLEALRQHRARKDAESAIDMMPSGSFRD